MADPVSLADHAGARLTHGKPKVNGVEVHYAVGGPGEPVFLLHGVPKTMSYWRQKAMSAMAVAINTAGNVQGARGTGVA